MPYEEVTVITWQHLLGEKWPPKDTNQAVFVIATMYDISETMSKALRNLSKAYPKALVSVFQSPRNLKRVTEADIGVQLVAQATLPPPEVDNIPIWQDVFIRRALDAGCVGALVNFECVALATDYPEHRFFRYTADELSTNV